MNIDTTLAEVFVPKTTPNVKLSPKVDLAKIELQKLQFQMHQHSIRNKKKYQPFFNFSETTSFDNCNMGDLVDKEIQRKLSNKGWKSLPMSFKWELICKYLESDEVKSNMCLTDISKLKASLRKDVLCGKEINVKYDVQQIKITQITV